MLKNTGVAFSAAERKLVYDLAGTHPLLLQAAAACVFDAKRGAEAPDVDRRVVLERFMDLTEHQWEDLWRWSTQGEQDVLMKMARHARAGIAALDRRANERSSLAKRGLIVSEDGGYRLFSPMLRQWLLERGPEGQPARAGRRAGPQSGRSMVFVSYSHKDEAEKEALLAHLRVLDRAAERVEVWSDDEMRGGDAWEASIEKAVLRARVAILLITANFLGSEFILGTEVPQLLARRDRHGVTVIPVIARACAWKNIAWLKKMNVRPKNGRAIWGEKGQPDEALAEIAEEVASIVGHA